MTSTQGLIMVEFSHGTVRIVNMLYWADCVARGLGTTPGDLWLHEMPVGYQYVYMRDGIGVTMRSMSDFVPL